jgi:hypothetical protein
MHGGMNESIFYGIYDGTKLGWDLIYPNRNGLSNPNPVLKF